MIILLSPAKKMDFTSSLPPVPAAFDAKGGEPPFLGRALSLVGNHLAGKSPGELEALMSINTELARTVSERYAAFGAGDNPRRAALFAYAGAVFQNMSPLSWDGPSLEFADGHIRILSALYGCLRPSDSIEPYRLDMKTPLSPGPGVTLRSFWKEAVTARLKEELRTASVPCILNTASAEFSSLVDVKKLDCPFITVHFKEKRGGKLKTVGTYAKMARGRLARKIVETKTAGPEAVKGWNIMGYRFSPGDSSGDTLLFCRE